MNELKNLSLEEKQLKSTELINKNPNRVPAIIVLDPKITTIELSKQKYLIPKKFNVNQLIIFLQKENMKKKNDGKDFDKTHFLTCQKKVMNGTQVISDVYDKNKHEDGFLYMTMCENVALGGVEI